MTGLPLKATAAVLFGNAISALLWGLLTAFVHGVAVLDRSNVATLQGSTAIVMGGLLFYFVKELPPPPPAPTVATPEAPKPPTA